METVQRSVHKKRRTGGGVWCDEAGTDGELQKKTVSGLEAAVREIQEAAEMKILSFSFDRDLVGWNQEDPQLMLDVWEIKMPVL